MPRTGGGGTMKMVPAVMEESACCNSAVIFSAVSRSPLSFSGTNIAAEFGAVVKVAPSKPAKATVARAPGFFSAIACACRRISSVRWSEVPGGICITPMR